MIPPLAVFGLVVDGAPFDLDLAYGVRALIVGHVVERLVEAEFLIREETGRLALFRSVADGYLPDFLVPSQGDEEEELDLEPVFRSRYPRIAHAVAAFVGIQLRLDGLPSGVPYRPRIVDVDIAAAHVVGDAVIAVARQAAQPRVLPEAIAARR